MLWLSRFGLKGRNPIALRKRGSSQNRTRQLGLECLESRLTPATLSVNATHSFLSELSVATAGSTLQIEPGAVIGQVNSSAGSVVGNVSAGSNIISSSELYTPGQIVTIGTGSTSETDLVTGSAPFMGSFVMTLSAPLAQAHNTGDPIAPVANT